MIVDSDGRFVSQRTDPVLQTIAVSANAAGLVLRCADREFAVGSPSSSPRSVTVWNDSVDARDAGDTAAAWLSDIVGKDVRLVEKAGPRATDSAYADASVGFADGFPILLTTAETVESIAARAGVAADARRFRPNIVVSGATPFAEDEWRAIRIGDLVLDMVKPCTRCTMVNVDPVSAMSGIEPLRSLASYRRSDRGVVVGQNAVHRSSGRIRVGQSVEILDTQRERSPET